MSRSLDNDSLKLKLKLKLKGLWSSWIDRQWL